MQQQADLARAARLLFDCLDRTTAWRLLATNAMAIAAGLIAGLAPLALKALVDTAQGDPGIVGAPSLTTLGASYLLCLSLVRISSEVRPVLTSAVEQRLYRRLRLRYFQHTLDLPLGFHLDERAGAAAHALQQGVTGYQIIVHSLLSSILPVVVEAITVSAVLLSLAQPLLTLVFAATTVAYVTAAMRRTRSFAAAAQKVSAAGADANGVLTESLTNIEPVKCFGAEAQMAGDFASATARLEHHWSELYRQRLRGGLVLLAVFVVSISASLLTATHGLREGTLTIGGFVLANMYMVQVLRPLDTLAAAVRDATHALAFIDPLLRILETPAELPTEPPSPETIESTHAGCSTRAEPCMERPGSARSCSARPTGHASRAPRIQFEDIELAFGRGDAVLSGLTLDIPAGRTTAIVGASGCGKSTVARLLLRLWTPASGTIRWDGQPIDVLPLEQLRSKIAIVPQDTVLFNRTIAANIGIGRPGATPSEIERAAKIVRLHDVVQALPAGYQTVIGERGLKMSGGERQRLAIARAILRDPLVFVFDEATSMLDSRTEQDLLKDLQQICAGRTTIMIAHRLAALRHADKIVVLAQGRVAEQGDHGMLLAHGGLYAAMWRAQQRDAVE